MFYDILDKTRLGLLPLFADWKKEFYLAGGTALALQIGHRDSVDFDFFSQNDIDTQKLFERLRATLAGHTLSKIQEDNNTLTILIDGSVKVSFFTYKYPLLRTVIDADDLSLASIEDIACMKLSAITGRASNKDYIDLYFILQRLPLADLLRLAQEKYPELDKNLILKSLVYFDDIVLEPIMFKNNSDIDFEKVKDKLRSEVRSIKN